MNSANEADRTRALSTVAANAAGLVHAVQNERAAAVMVLGAIGTDARATFDKKVSDTDKAKTTYQSLRAVPIADLPVALSDRFERIDIALADLPRMRQQITGGPALAMTVATTRYTTLIDDLLGIRDDTAQLAGGDHVANDLRVASALANLKENVSLERIIVLTALSRHALPSVLRRDFQLAVIEQDQAQQAFISTATPWQRDQYNQFVIGTDLREAYKLRGVIETLVNEARSDSEQLPADIFTPQQWDNALGGKSELLRKAQVEIDKSVINDTTAARASLWRQVLIETGVLLGMLLLSIVFAWMVARSMARSLRELRHGALTLAQYGLPQAVARLRDPAMVAQSSPQRVAEQIADPLPIRSRDEFGQVAEAFNQVHLEAVRTAAEQAVLRAGVATMFVNLARRSQILVDRLIGHLDRLERGEEDPDRLAELFQLDHLATRMRRNDENLLVLAGADSSRVQRDPASLMDVMRAAQSEVEHYTRIEFGATDRDIEIASHAVNDLVHLIAELLDNATAFSPPDSAVIVEAKRVGDRAALLVEDHGIGISAEQLAEHNERLANPPTVDVTVSRMMGLVVVARLAARHGVKVELRAARERGTVAELTLPVGVLVPRALAGRGAAPQVASQPAQGGHPGSPMALERGPAPAGTFTGGNSGGGANGGGYFGGGDGAPAGGGGAPAGGGSFGLLNAFGHRSGGPAPNGAGTQAPPPASSAPMPPPPRSPLAQPRGPMPPAAAGAGQPPASGRHLPSWSDLTGADTTGPEPAGRQGAGAGRPLPPRRGADPWGLDDEHEAAEPPRGGAIPRQRSQMHQPPAQPSQPVAPAPAPVSPAAPQAAPQWPSAAPASPAGPGMPPPPSPSAPQAAPAPPAWPPVPASQAPAAPPAGPSGPDLSADMTAEMPAVRLTWEPPAEQTQAAAAADQRFVDETMELPIYRELESVWFSTKRKSTPQPESASLADQASMVERIPTSPRPAEQPQAPVPAAAREPSPVPAVQEPAGVAANGGGSTGPTMSTGRSTAAHAPTWQTAADDGWQAAAALAEKRDFVMTETGLPKRVPMSQLVPGGVERAPASSSRRSPEAVRGLLSAYHRGVQRGRTHHGSSAGDAKTPERSTAGPQTSQGGKEYEA